MNQIRNVIMGFLFCFNFNGLAVGELQSDIEKQNFSVVHNVRKKTLL